MALFCRDLPGLGADRSGGSPYPSHTHGHHRNHQTEKRVEDRGDSEPRANRFSREKQEQGTHERGGGQQQNGRVQAFGLPTPSPHAEKVRHECAGGSCQCEVNLASARRSRVPRMIDGDLPRSACPIRLRRSPGGTAVGPRLGTRRSSYASPSWATPQHALQSQTEASVCRGSSPSKRQVTVQRASVGSPKEAIHW